MKNAKAYETNRNPEKRDILNLDASKSIMKMNAKLKSSISLIKNQKAMGTYKSTHKSASQNNSLEKEMLCKSKSKQKLKAAYEKQ